MAVVDRGSFYVEGYFEETKLPGIQVGDKVDVSLMGTRQRCPATSRALRKASPTATAAPAPTCCRT
jgi:multidrug resistance efflux pump